MPNLTNLLIMLVCINFSMAILGYTNSYDDIANGWLERNAGGGGTQVTLSGTFAGAGNVNGVSSIINTIILASLAGLGLTIVAGFFGSGFSVIYFLPAFTVVIIGDLILRTTGFLSDPTIPVEIKTLIFVVIGIVTITTVISYMRGYEA